MVKRLIAFDFDKTLMQTPEPEEGMEIWREKTGTIYPKIGWWSKPESLDLDVFDIKPFPKVLNVLRKEMLNPESYVIILTSRIEKLRPNVQAVLDANQIDVHKLDMNQGKEVKGDKILNYIKEFPDLEEINVYDDREKDIISYKQIRNSIPENIVFKIYLAVNGQLNLLEAKNKLIDVIQEEIKNFNDEYIYHGTYDGAGHSIQRYGGMKLQAVNNEPYISFTSKPDVARYYADMKGGKNRGIILRTKLSNDFSLSPKFTKNKGHEWITDKEIPINKLEISTQYGWIPLSKWDFIDKKII